jgi:hypothetical protein
LFKTEVMDKDQAKLLIEETIRGARHEFYDHTVKVAKECHSYMTGTKQEKLLRRFKSRETDSQMTQRENLFLSPTRGAISPISNIYRKIRFLDPDTVKKRPTLEGAKEDALTTFMNNAWENQTIEDYLYDISEFYNFYDPNAQIIIQERRERNSDGDVENIVIYPLEANSEQVVNYHLEQGKIEWTVLEYKAFEKLKSTNGKRQISKFYIYAPGVELWYLEYHETIPPSFTRLAELKTGSKLRKFAVYEFQTTTVETPAFRVGCYMDPETQNSTFSPPYWEAIMKLDEIVRDKSMQDVNIVGHYYPKEYVFSPSCDYVDKEKNLKCVDGYVGMETCPACGGKSYDLHISEQDRIILALPPGTMEVPDLSKLIYWHLPPDWLAKYMDERLTNTEKAIFRLTFNTELLDKPTGETPTATGEIIDYEAIQQKLTPYAKIISDNWRKSIRIAIQYLEAWEKGLPVEHSFPKDHKLQTLEQLIAYYAKAKAAGLPYFILRSIEDKIIAKEQVDNPQLANLYKAFRNHLPFKDKDPSSIIRILQDRATDDFDRLVWENSDKIYQLLIVRKDNFAEMKYDAQREVIQQLIEEVQKGITMPAPMALPDQLNFN